MQRGIAPGRMEATRAHEGVVMPSTGRCPVSGLRACAEAVEGRV